MNIKNLNIDVKDPIKTVGHSNYYAHLTELFQKMVEVFEQSTKSFSITIKTFHEKIDRQFPEELRKLINEYVEMMVTDYFGGGGFYPKRSPFKRISEKVSNDLCKIYFKDTFFKDTFFGMGWIDMQIILDVMYSLYVEPHEKNINTIIENLLFNEVKLFNEILEEDQKMIVLNEYFQGNSSSVKLSMKSKIKLEKTVPYFKEIAKFSNILIPNFICVSFHDLSYFDKKILLEMAWNLSAPTYERKKFTNDKFSSDDKKLLMDLCVNGYLDLYNLYYLVAKKK